MYTARLEGNVQLLTADLIREGLKFATSLEHHFLADNPDMKCVLKCQCNLSVAGYQQT